MTNPPKIMDTTLTVIWRKTKILRTQRICQIRKSLPGTISTTLFLSPLLNTSLRQLMVNTRSASRKERSSGYLTWPSSRKTSANLPHRASNGLHRFQAFLLYLYTNSIEFAPYGSEDNRKSRSAEIVSVSEDSIPRPSPKSIYRLADKVSDHPLLDG